MEIPALASTSLLGFALMGIHPCHRLPFKFPALLSPFAHVRRRSFGDGGKPKTSFLQRSSSAQRGERIDRKDLKFRSADDWHNGNCFKSADSRSTTAPCSYFYCFLKFQGIPQPRFHRSRRSCKKAVGSSKNANVHSDELMRRRSNNGCKE